MISNKQMEHFVTLFDNNFLPAGLCLYRSLKENSGPFCLWVLCLDDLVLERLKVLGLPEVRLIPLPEVETQALKSAKSTRSWREYCWTLSPFAPQFVFDREPSVTRVTYIDADLHFFDDPAILFHELEDSGAAVLITEHAYAPEYDQSEKSGVYCVQFMTFSNNLDGLEVLHWWQERCLEWCFARSEDGKFGDQKYLDDWPNRFEKKVHVLQQKNKALGPWNASLFSNGSSDRCVFYHFHGFRIVAPRRFHLFRVYYINKNALAYYDTYVDVMKEIILEFNRRGWVIPFLPEKLSIKSRVRNMIYAAQGRVAYRKF